MKNNFIKSNTKENESKAKIESENSNSIHKFNSLNLLDSNSTKITNIDSGDIKNFDVDNDENEIEDETINHGYLEENEGIKFGSAINEISSMNIHILNQFPLSIFF